MTVDTPTAIRLTQLHIGGEFVDAAEGGTFDTFNPATGALLAQVAEGRAEDVDRAVAAARRASGAWAALDVFERLRMLRRVCEVLRERSDELAMVESLDSGKPLHETLAYPDLTAYCLEYFAELAQSARTEVIPTPTGFLNYTLRQPFGVVGAIVPWNFPLPFCGAKCGPILAAGNTVVLKPAEQTPLTALLFAEACRDAGLPDGVVNVVPGMGPTAGRAIVEHPGVGMVSFTGSTDVGREIGGAAGQLLKPVVLELGGKAPNIVFADADLEAAAVTALYMVAFNQGQVCSAGRGCSSRRPSTTNSSSASSRTRARRAWATRWIPRTQVGAVVSPVQLERIERYVAIGQEEGAELLFGGGRPRRARPRATGGSTSRRSSAACAPRCGSRRRRSSGRCSPYSRSRARSTRWSSRTTSSTD